MYMYLHSAYINLYQSLQLLPLTIHVYDGWNKFQQNTYQTVIDLWWIL